MSTPNLPDESSSYPPKPPPQPAPKSTSLVEKWWGLPGSSKAIIGVIAGILLLILIFGTTGNNQQRQECVPSTASKSTPASSDFNPPGTIDKEVRDGKFAFVVTGIQACQGEPIKVSMKVTNTGTEAETFSPSEQVLLRNPSHPTGQIPEGGWACTRCDGDGDGEQLNINPGDSVATLVSFDIKGEEPAVEAIELHDSLLSFGVKVYP